MGFEGSSSSDKKRHREDEDQSREGKPNKRRDRTRFLRPDRSRSVPPCDKEQSPEGEDRTQEGHDRSHSVPPDLQKKHTIAIASKDTFETLETQCMQLIKDFERFSKKAQPNIDLNSFSDLYIYTALVQSYSLYQHSRYAFDIAEHNKDLSTSQREQLSLNEDRLNTIKDESYKAIEPLDTHNHIYFLNIDNKKFLEDAKARMRHIKDLDDFLKDIKKNIVEGKSLSEEQSRTYKKLERETHSHTTKRLNEDYCHKTQQILVDQEFQRIRSTSAEVDFTVDLIRRNHPTLRDLTAQYATISRWYNTLREEYEARIQPKVSSQKLGVEETDHLVEARPDAPYLTNDQHPQAPLPKNSEKIERNHTPSKSEKYQLSSVVHFIREYKIMEKNFYKENDKKNLKKHERYILERHRKMIQIVEESIKPFLEYCMSWAREREASEEKDTIPFLAPQKDSG